MRASTFMTGVSLILAALLAASPPERGLVVHEWGTFTSIVDADGAPIACRPLDGPSELPSFVMQDPGDGKGTIAGTVRMETPVVYFYSDREIDASVRVRFPNGKITEWFPAAIVKRSTIEWPSVRVLPGAAAPFPVTPEPSPYYRARETDAAPLRVDSSGAPQWERFLFYRGVGTFELPLAISVEGDSIRARNVSRGRIGGIIRFENRDGRLRAGFHGALEPGDGALLPPPAESGGMEEIARRFPRMLVEAGLYEAEGLAMLRTWQDLWFEEGTRLFYLVPREFTDAVLPFEIEPPPAALERVLVGRLDVRGREGEANVRERIDAVTGSR